MSKRSEQAAIDAEIQGLIGVSFDEIARYAGLVGFRSVAGGFRETWDEPAIKIGGVEQVPESAVLTHKTIVAATAEICEVEVATLLSKNRTRKVIDARHIAMYLDRELLSFSFPQIGHAFNNMDHTSAMNAVSRISAIVDPESENFDPYLVAYINQIKDSLEIRLPEAETTLHPHLMVPLPADFLVTKEGLYAYPLITEDPQHAYNYDCRSIDTPRLRAYGTRAITAMQQLKESHSKSKPHVKVSSEHHLK